MNLDFILENGNWPKDVELWGREAAQALGAQIDLPAVAEIAVLLTNDDHIRKLNAEFRDKDKATNVLSWPSQEFEREEGKTPKPLPPFDDFLGDLAFGYETCVNEAAEIGFEPHFKHLIIHGILHLLGYDHISEKDALTMEALEIAALAGLNIDNPYE